MLTGAERSKILWELNDRLAQFNKRLSQLSISIRYYTMADVWNRATAGMIDRNKVEQAVRLLLEGMGEDPSREGLIDTPERVARMYEELYSGMDEHPGMYLEKTFRAENNDLIVEKDITFYSVCEHHLLPFYGKVHVAYVPDKKVAGLSKLARTVEVFSRRLQIQEQLTAQIADALMDGLAPRGVMVMMEAEHMCMTMRGIKKPGSRTVTVVKRGCFCRQEDLVNLFFQMVRG